MMNYYKGMWLLITLAHLSAYADEHCLDNSKHMNTACGPDYKEYYRVYRCTCPCNRYAQSFNRGRCEVCLHYRASNEPINDIDPFD
jgi:hypothetical protein